MDFFSGENLINIIKTVGYFGIFGIVFAESGILVGFFLPGDSLLFTAGFLASQGFLNIFLLNLIIFVAAVLGDNVGYTFGKKVGPKIFNKEESLFFHKDNLIKAEKFYEKYGSITIILARFIPFVRTFAPIVAGIGKMNYKTFVLYNIVGGFLWTTIVTWAGYFLGKLIPDVDKYLLPIILGIVVLSVLPPLFHLIREKLKSK
jgi:membrane-associated protein